VSSPIAQRIIAEHLLRIGAIEFLIDNPLRLKSGLISPIYVDNRKLISQPNAWHDVIETLGSKIEQYGLKFDMIAGVETAGIPHCSALAYRLRLPTLFVRRQAKTHGDKSRIEGADVSGKHVLLIEDHISTGQSTLDAVTALKEQGATVTDCLSLTTFDLEDTRQLFKDSGVTFHALLPFSEILNVAVQDRIISSEQKNIIQEWLNDPWPWAARYGHLPTDREN
jgi:orotate phosphoribosyltransferase